jgi:hypothetical protein
MGKGLGGEEREGQRDGVRGEGEGHGGKEGSWGRKGVRGEGGGRERELHCKKTHFKK